MGEEGWGEEAQGGQEQRGDGGLHRRGVLLLWPEGVSDVYLSVSRGAGERWCWDL